MKKFVSIIFAVFLTAISFAQSITPRTGVSPYTATSNTYENLACHFLTRGADAAGLDTISYTPRAFHTTVRITSVLDSFAIKISSVSSCFVGDELEFHILNSSTGVCVRFAGALIANQNVTNGGLTNTVMYLTASKPAYIKFVFNGAVWVEACRVKAEN